MPAWELLRSPRLLIASPSQPKKRFLSSLGWRRVCGIESGPVSAPLPPTRAPIPYTAPLAPPAKNERPRGRTRRVHGGRTGGGNSFWNYRFGAALEPQAVPFEAVARRIQVSTFAARRVYARVSPGHARPAAHFRFPRHPLASSRSRRVHIIGGNNRERCIQLLPGSPFAGQKRIPGAWSPPRKRDATGSSSNVGPSSCEQGADLCSTRVGSRRSGQSGEGATKFPPDCSPSPLAARVSRGEKRRRLRLRIIRNAPQFLRLRVVTRHQFTLVVIRSSEQSPGS
jgi:hypothetical protein